jgi:hypothetical protein
MAGRGRDSTSVMAPLLREDATVFGISHVNCYRSGGAEARSKIFKERYAVAIGPESPSDLKAREQRAKESDPAKGYTDK